VPVINAQIPLSKARTASASFSASVDSRRSDFIVLNSPAMHHVVTSNTGSYILPRDGSSIEYIKIISGAVLIS